MKLSAMKKSMIAALCAALCVVLPQALSIIPGTDGGYGALHMPVLLCAFVCGGGSGMLCALIGLCLSAVIAGTPTAMMLPVILGECMFSALFTGFFRKLSFFKKPERSAAFCFAAGIILGRLCGAAISAALFTLESTAFLSWAGGYFVSAMPGMIVQMVLLSMLVMALSNGGLICLDK